MRRRAWMIGAGAGVLCAACGSEESAPVAHAGPVQIWEPVDPAFAGCQGTCGGHADGLVDGVVVQPGALPGQRAYCPVSGAVFEVDPAQPHVEIAGGTLWFCCRACFTYFQDHQDDVLRARGLATRS